jgi:hypothetical protein
MGATEYGEIGWACRKSNPGPSTQSSPDSVLLLVFSAVCTRDALRLALDSSGRVTDESSVLWGITPRSPFIAHRRFGGTYRVQLQGRRISQEVTFMKEVR